MSISVAALTSCLGEHYKRVCTGRNVGFAWSQPGIVTEGDVCASHLQGSSAIVPELSETEVFLGRLWLQVDIFIALHFIAQASPRTLRVWESSICLVVSLFFPFRLI